MEAQLQLWDQRGTGYANGTFVTNVLSNLKHHFKHIFHFVSYR